MTAVTKNKHLQNCKLVDYTGSLTGFKQWTGFGPEFVSMIRNSAETAKSVVVVDRAFDSRFAGPMIVRDHVNVSGNNPLLGPNHPAGERFPVVQGVYLCGLFPDLREAVVAGLKEGVRANEPELQALRTIGVDACTYNMVPSMLIAAHAGWKVLGIVLSENETLTEELLSKIMEMRGAN